MNGLELLLSLFVAHFTTHDVVAVALGETKMSALGAF